MTIEWFIDATQFHRISQISSCQTHNTVLRYATHDKNLNNTRAQSISSNVWQNGFFGCLCCTAQIHIVQYIYASTVFFFSRCLIVVYTTNVTIAPYIYPFQSNKFCVQFPWTHSSCSGRHKSCCNEHVHIISYMMSLLDWVNMHGILENMDFLIWWA